MIGTDDCLDCEEWRQYQGNDAHCFDCAYERTMEYRRSKLKALEPKPPKESTKKPIAHQPVKRAVKPRKSAVARS